MSLLNLFDQIDKTLFVLIHNDSDHNVFDNIMLLLRNPYTWIPLYLFILFYAIIKGKNKAWKFVLLSLVVFAITDSVTAQILKPFFARLRPCCEPQLQGLIRNVIDFEGIYSFPSSHAANHFGLAAFWYWSVWLMAGIKWKWLWAWAAVVCYAQVYVGKHYPSDALAGVFLAGLLAFHAQKFSIAGLPRQRNLCHIA